MKFEQLLQVYWSKGFFFAGRMRSFNMSIDELFSELDGLRLASKLLFIKRFEFGYFKYKINKSLIQFPLDHRKVFNMYLSQMTSVNNDITELLRYNLIRLYLIRSFRGKAQALGKPSRGQRTWSNACTSYKISSALKTFVNEIRKSALMKKKPESKNRKILKKKTKTSNSGLLKKEKKKNNLWF